MCIHIYIYIYTHIYIYTYFVFRRTARPRGPGARWRSGGVAPSRRSKTEQTNIHIKKLIHIIILHNNNNNDNNDDNILFASKTCLFAEQDRINKTNIQTT